MNSSSETTFGKSLRLARESKKLTQTQLADLAGTSQQNIAGMEAGRSLPKQAIFDKLCEVFGQHSSVAQLPPRGVIRMGYDVVEDVMEKSRSIPLHTSSQQPLSPQAQELAELFDMLPQDKLTRVAVHRQCTGLLLEHLARASTPAVLATDVQAHRL